MKITLEETAELLKRYRRFVITAHVNPDGDAVGSVLALTYLLRAMGKEAHCLLNDDVPRSFAFLPGVQEIRKPEGKAQADLLIVLDSSDLERVGAVGEAAAGLPILNIDHHVSNEDAFAEYLYLDSHSAATGELIFRLYKALGLAISQEAAVCLYTAIATDCGFFRYSNTKAETMRCAAELLACGVRPNLVSEAIEKKSLGTVKAIARVIDTLELFAEGRIACVTLTPEVLEGCETTEGMVDFARVVEGVDVAVMVKYVEPKVTRVSMRSISTDVSEVALRLGGGGHKRAAGCTIYDTVLRAREIIVQEIGAALRGAQV